MMTPSRSTSTHISPRESPSPKFISPHVSPRITPRVSHPPVPILSRRSFSPRSPHRSFSPRSPHRSLSPRSHRRPIYPRRIPSPEDELD